MLHIDIIYNARRGRKSKIDCIGFYVVSAIGQRYSALVEQ